MFRVSIFATCLLLSAAVTANSAEIDFIEDFVLAPDRVEALGQLIPGSEDYYYYQCLHLQATEQYDKVDQMLRDWIKRYQYTPRVYEIQNRQALLIYERDPQQTLELLKKRLRIKLDHQRERLGETPNLPTELAPDLLSRLRLRERAFRKYKNLDGFEDSSLDWLILTDLDPDRRRNLLERLSRPDHDQLARTIVADLAHRYAKPFGSLAIHRNLLLIQLDEVARFKPELLNQTEYVNIYMSKLQPNGDSDWQNDSEVYQAYLDRVWQFVSRLAPAHNSLKAHVLYHRLDHDRRSGRYDKAKFLAYLKLPRQVAYIAKTFLARSQNRRFVANLQTDYAEVTGLPAVGDDEPLVRSYFHHFFITETTTTTYEPFVDNVYLRHRLAETKIVNGLGEEEEWYSLLPPAMYQELKERIDLEFAPTNKREFGPTDQVTLDLFVKNVQQLIVKVYEINAANYYRQHGREVNTDINLDGLVANEEMTFQYSETPLRRVRRRFEMPQLAARGVYVVDFIGNGLSSRAVIRKGMLHHIERYTSAGHLLTIFDEEGREVTNATLWLGGHSYSADDAGHILVPYSAKPAEQPIVLTSGSFSSLARFRHATEDFRLKAGFHVDRESLLARRSAELLVRPGLTVNGTRVSLKILDEVQLRIVSTDQSGIVSTQEVEDFALSDDRESLHTLQVPARLSKLRFELRATLPRLTGQGKIELVASDEVNVNQIAATEHVDDLHLSRTTEGYYLELLGRTGERKTDRSIRLSFKHRDFRDPVDTTLQSDRQGRISLGVLPGVQTLTATSANGVARSWPLNNERHWYHQTISSVASHPIEIPFMETESEPARSSISLLETRGSTYHSDHFNRIAIRNGMLVIAGLSPGNYDLLLKQSGQRIRLNVVGGTARDSHAMGRNRLVELKGAEPLQLQQLIQRDGKLRIQTVNAGPSARVHLFAHRYRPAFSAFDQLAAVTDSEPSSRRLGRATSLYAAGRQIGDEYQYIIDRKYAAKYPGLMATRPSLLLNPWALRSTETDNQAAKPGSQFGAEPTAPPIASSRQESRSAAAEHRSDHSNLDYLRDASLVLANLIPDEKGVIEVSLDKFGSYQELHALAVDANTIAERSFVFPTQDGVFQDLRLATGLDPAKHFTQQKQITIVGMGETFKLDDFTTSRFEVYDSLARVHALFTTLSADPQLAEFQFVLDWPGLSAEEKKTLYSKYACHELNFFLWKKDHAFFGEVVEPFIRNKKDKTFLDHWLLQSPLENFVQPWRYGQLNCAERILLSQRLETDRAYTRRDVLDRFALIPVDLDRFSRLFQTAISTSALDASNEFARAKAGVAGVELQLGGGGGYANGLAADTPFAEKGVGRSMQMLSRSPARLQEEGLAESKDAFGFQLDQTRMRDSVRQLYQTLDRTQEWAENNYYQVPIEQQDSNLIKVNRFWRDYAQHDAEQPFLSTGFVDAAGSFAEMMLTLALLDLPFDSPDHETTYAERSLTLSAGGPMVVFYEEVRESESQADATPILVSQNFFRRDDRYRFVDNERRDKFITEEFLVQTVYGCQVVVTNPTSSPQKLDALLQVPVGSIPVLSGQQTKSEHLQLDPYNTKTIEYFFYFPAAGRYQHYPVNVAKNEQFLAASQAAILTAVEELSRIDRESWEYISQNGSAQDVLDYLTKKNLYRIELNKIAFRMQSRPFFLKVLDILERRHQYDRTLWAYAVKHGHEKTLRTFLEHEENFVQQCGLSIRSRLLDIDPVLRRSYQHTDYRPLVNARAHQLGRRRQILNNRLHSQYHSLLKVLSYRRQLDDNDRLDLTYYLLLQDRFDEALAQFSMIDVTQVATRLQYDYFAAYLAMIKQDVGQARQIANAYALHGVDRWRNAFAEIVQQLDEVSGSRVEVIDSDNRDQTQTQLADSDASLDFSVEAKRVTMSYQNLKDVDVNYYLMDIELLYSRNPFVQQYSNQFSHIRPNLHESITLPELQGTHEFPLPEALHNRNVLIEVRGGGETRTQAYYSNALSVQLIENYGQLRVHHAQTGKPLPAVYAKVYARMKNGSIRFFKDGYTDLRGRFDYSSLSTNDLDHVERFSVLVLSEEHGAVVREANPPQR